jgi:hypothetical protein
MKPMIAEKIEVINTAPAAASLMIFIFGLKFGSISLQRRSIEVFIPSKDNTDIEQIKTHSHSYLEILKNSAKITSKMKIPN